MSSKLVYGLTSIMPSYAAQTMMDVGAFWNRPIIGGMYNNREKAGDHLRDLRVREMLAHPPGPDMTKGDIQLKARSELGVKKIYNRADVGGIGALKLLAWTLVGYVTAWFGLRAKERG